MNCVKARESTPFQCNIRFTTRVFVYTVHDKDVYRILSDYLSFLPHKFTCFRPFLRVIYNFNSISTFSTASRTGILLVFKYFNAIFPLLIGFSRFWPRPEQVFCGFASILKRYLQFRLDFDAFDRVPDRYFTWFQAVNRDICHFHWISTLLTASRTGISRVYKYFEALSATLTRLSRFWPSAGPAFHVFSSIVTRYFPF